MTIRQASRISPWKLASPYGISLGANLWNTGSVWTVCSITPSQLLIGTEQGGLWVNEIATDGSHKNRCVSDSWEHWRFLTCVQDPTNSKRVFVGTGRGLTGPPGVYLGDFAFQPEAWTYIPLPPSVTPDGAGNVDPTAAVVTAMIILPLQRLLVVATGVGLCWTQIDTLPLIWYTTPDPIEYLANLTGDEFLAIVRNPKGLVPSAAPDTRLVRSTISLATYTSSNISPSSISWRPRRARGRVQTPITPYRIASCQQSPTNVYCLGSVNRAGYDRMFIIRSVDAGTTWTECAYNVLNISSGDLADVLDFFEFGPKSNYSIAVHPKEPKIIATGFGGAAVSIDSGDDWFSLNGVAGWHADVHELRFEPDHFRAQKVGTPSKYSLFVPSDGGILQWREPNTSDTSRNQTLPVVMLYSPDRHYALGLGNLASDGNVIIAGSQDNANLWLDTSNQVWRLVAGAGDGGCVAVSNEGLYQRVLQTSNDNRGTKTAVRSSPTSWGPSSVVPLRLSSASIDMTGLRPAVFRTVAPTVGLTVGEDFAPVIALASPQDSNLIYAATIVSTLDAPGAVLDQRVEWSLFGQLPPGQIIWSIEAHSSESILVGTVSGRAFILTRTGTLHELTFDQKPTGAIGGIASNGALIACFEVRGSWLAHGTAPTSNLNNGKARPRSGPLNPSGLADLELVQVAAFARNDGASGFHSICANRSQTNKYVAFALTANENEVWISRSSNVGRWQLQVSGLPHAVRCSDLTFTDSVEGGRLLLSTYGRGVWRMAF